MLIGLDSPVAGLGAQIQWGRLGGLFDATMLQAICFPSGV
jgi:hypothetical protein